MINDTQSGPPLDAWALSGDLVALSGGHRNRVLRLRGQDETGVAVDLVVKSTSRCEAALRWLGPVQDTARAAGFVVPGLIPSRRGQLSERGWTVEPYLEGTPVATAPEALVRAFHRLAAGMGQRPGFLAARDLVTAIRGGDIDLSAMPAPLVAACRAAWSALPAGPLCAIHGDVGPGNILAIADNRISLIDWDEARVDLGLFDLGHAGQAALAWEIACCWQLEPARARALAADFLAAR